MPVGHTYQECQCSGGGNVHCRFCALAPNQCLGNVQAQREQEPPPTLSYTMDNASYMDRLMANLTDRTERIAQQANIYANVPRWGAEPRQERVESRLPSPGGEKGTCICGKPRL